MSGDWIKFTHAVLDKPEIRKTARMLGVKHGEALELYLRWWVWLDVNSVDGLVDALVDADVDQLFHTAGFAACMREVGWLTTDAETGKLRVTRFYDHNGESSKKRALKNKRQSKWRSNVDADVDGPVDTPPSTKASTREEKRREDLKPKAMSSSPETANVDVHPLSLNTKNSERREQAREILGFLNSKTDRNYRMVDANLGPLMARLKEGATVRDLRAVIARKCREWAGDDKMAGYLRPKTLFNATNFAQYVGEVPPPEALDGASLS